MSILEEKDSTSSTKQEKHTTLYTLGFPRGCFSKILDSSNRDNKERIKKLVEKAPDGILHDRVFGLPSIPEATTGQRFLNNKHEKIGQIKKALEASPYEEYGKIRDEILSLSNEYLKLSYQGKQSGKSVLTQDFMEKCETLLIRCLTKSEDLVKKNGSLSDFNNKLDEEWDDDQNTIKKEKPNFNLVQDIRDIPSRYLSEYVLWRYHGLTLTEDGLLDDESFAKVNDFPNEPFTPELLKKILGIRDWCVLQSASLIWHLCRRWKMYNGRRPFHFSYQACRYNIDEYFIYLAPDAMKRCRLIKGMEQLGILKTLSQTGFARDFIKNHGFPALHSIYIVNPLRIKAFMNYCHKNGIDTFAKKCWQTVEQFYSYDKYCHLAEKTAKDDPERWEKLLQKVKVGKGLRIPASKYTLDEIRAALITVDPLIASTILMVEYANKLNGPQNPCVARINIRLSESRKNYSKIGFRVSSNYASLKKNGEGLNTRAGFFNNHFGFEHYREFDITSSIPYFAGIYNGSDASIKKDYYLAFKPEAMTEEEFRNSGLRDACKKVALQMAFTNSPGELYNKTRLRPESCIFFDKFNNNFGEKATLQFFSSLYNKFKQSVGGRFPKSYGFVIESFVMSFLYLIVSKMSSEQHLPSPLMVYDCLYVSKDLVFDESDVKSFEDFIFEKQVYFIESALKPIIFNLGDNNVHIKRDVKHIFTNKEECEKFRETYLQIVNNALINFGLQKIEITPGCFSKTIFGDIKDCEDEDLSLTELAC